MQVRLGSNQLVFTPGILRWAINGYKFKRDRANLRNVFTSGFGLPDDTVHRLLSGEIEHQIEGDVVIFDDPQLAENWQEQAQPTA